MYGDRGGEGKYRAHVYSILAGKVLRISDKFNIHRNSGLVCVL